MTKFNPNATCVKCAGTEVRAAFRGAYKRCSCEEHEDERYSYLCPKAIETPERMTRTCKFCGYSWDELPLDAE